ncbi:MAG: transposase [Patescibacteria group bacterium]
MEKRVIFQDEQDYSVFLSYLKDYLMPKNREALLDQIATTTSKEKDRALKLLKLNNFSNEITLLAHCLMSNHLHFLVKQTKADSIDRFMSSLGTRYTMYFNKKYKRVGTLCQGVYKAVLVETDEQLLHLTRYIHKQALASQGETLRSWEAGQPCSYPEYLGKRKTEWVKPEEILTFFSKTNKKLSYKSFVNQEAYTEPIVKLTLED